MTIGVLYPSSEAHPSIGSDFLDGLKSFLCRNGSIQTEVQLVVEGIGFGGAEKEVYNRAEKLLRIEKVDVLVAFIDLRILTILEPLVYSMDRILIVINAGANYPYNWIPQPTVLYLNLQHAFLCHLTGKLAAETSSTEAAVATSFYDCGYLHVAAMTNGFAEQGGQVVYNFVHPQSYTPFNISPLTNFLDTHSHVLKILCLFDELPASLIYPKLSEIKSKDLQLFVSPMMLEDKALTNLPSEIPFSINGYRSWLPESKNENNQTFRKSYESYADKAASVFALLGWEAGLMLQQIIQQCNNALGAKAVEILKEMTWQSPRGTVYLDRETHYLLAPAIRYTINDGIITTNEVALSTIQESWSLFSDKPAEGVSSGWTNSYLCY